MQILMAHFKNYKKEVLSAIISIFIVAFVAVWQPRLLQYVLTAIVQDNQVEVRNYGIQLIILALVGIIAGIVNVYSAARVAQGVTSDLREEVYTKIQDFSFGNIEKFSTGSLVVRLINDMNQVTKYDYDHIYASFPGTFNFSWCFYFGNNNRSSLMVARSSDGCLNHGNNGNYFQKDGIFIR